VNRNVSQCCGIKQYTQTDTHVTANRPDIIIKNKREKTCTLIDVAVPADRNVVQKEAEKKLNTRFFFLIFSIPLCIGKLIMYLLPSVV
jgi:hypothetical protein